MPEFMSPPSGSARVLLLGSNPEALSMLGREYSAISAGVPAAQQFGAVGQLPSSLQRGDVELAIVESPTIGDAELSAIEGALGASPHTALVLVTPQMSSEALLRAMRAGVREVVLANSPPSELAEAIRRQLDRLGAATAPAARGRVVAFMPAKGGSGATFLATNLGYALSLRDQRVAVIDLNLQFGDVSLFVTDRKPTSDIAQVCRDIDRLDGSMLESSMVQAADRLWLLSAPESPERAVDVRPEAIQRLLSIARSRFDVVVLDVGRTVDAVSIRALDEADLVYVVIQHTIPTLHDAGRLLGLLSGLGYPSAKVQLIANRVEKNTEIGPAEVRKALGLDARMQVPNSYTNVVGAINHGEPILKASPKDPVARSLADWADALVPQSEKRTGWLRGLFGARP